MIPTMNSYTNRCCPGYLHLVTFILVYSVTTAQYSSQLCFGPPVEHRSTSNADFIIGGMFPVHYKSGLIYKYNPPGLMWVQAMLFAIEEINNRTSILPNVTLGYRIFDTCNTIEIALKETLHLTQGLVEDSTNTSPDVCPCIATVNSMISLVGDAASLTTTKVASVLAATKTPQISYSATSTVLSNKYLYESFMRTIPPDNFQAILITDFMEHFGWKYVNVIACDDDYGRIGVDELLPRFREKDICLAVYEVYDVKNDKNDELTREVVRKLKDEHEATVIVLWCQRPEALRIISVAEKMKLYHRTWIATETYGNTDRLYEYSPEVVRGLFGIIPAQKHYRPFVEKLRRITPNNTAFKNPWLHDYWVNHKKCNVTHNQKYICPDSNTDLTSLPTNKYVNVIDSVYAIANGLHNYLNARDGGKVAETVRPEELLPFVKNVSFTGKSNTTISFNEQGNPAEAMYSLTNLQYDKLSLAHVVVGSWNFKTRRITMDTRGVQFANLSRNAPKSSCREECNPGFKGLSFGDKPCCWKCVRCPEGEVQPDSGKRECIRCSDNRLPNGEHTKCLSPIMTYLSPSSKSGAVVIGLMALGYTLIVTSIVIFIKYRHTPIVKASNRGLSMLQIFSMMCQLALPVLYMQEKTSSALCGATLFYFIFFYTITVSVTFTKADRLLRVFEASKSGILAKHSAMKGNLVQYVTVCLLTMVGMTLCTIMYALFRPGVAQEVRYEHDEVHMVYSCGGLYDTILFSLVGYIVVISLVCSVYAFKARKLPHDFNEARYTSFAMFMFLLTWTMAVPIYFSQADKTGKAASVCLLTFVSTIVIFVPMYLPKCYVILFQAEKNTEAKFRENLKKTRHLGVGSASDSEPSSVQLRTTTLPSSSESVNSNVVDVEHVPNSNQQRIEK